MVGAPYPPPALGGGKRCGISVSFVLGTMRLQTRTSQRSCWRPRSPPGLGGLRELEGRVPGEAEPHGKG